MWHTELGIWFMKTVNISSAKTHLSSLVEQAAAGEEIIIAKAGKPVARLVKLGNQTSGRWGCGKAKSG